MQKLIEGLHRFQKDIVPEKREQMRRLAGGQSPIALFITCSDSRIVPDLIMQTEPGELFILRNAGNIVPPYNPGNAGGESGTIEYAVSVLGIKDIILCGHTECGAMKGLLHPESVSEVPVVASWLRQAEATRRVVGEIDRRSAGLFQESNTAEEKHARLTMAVQHNVLIQMDNLRTHPAVAAALAVGNARLHGWVYNIETGDMSVYDDSEARFRPAGAFYAQDRVLTAAA